ncbi:MAG: hypothetical protein WA667_07080 [Candidatus Nitrosopolaris sp.]
MYLFADAAAIQDQFGEPRRCTRPMKVRRKNQWRNQAAKEYHGNGLD